MIKIFELYALGNNSFQTIASKMRAQGFAKTSRGKSITARTVEIILKNHFYIGLMRIKDKLYPHKYPSLIATSLFNNVQSIITKHHKAPVQYAGKPILLRGLISCKNCGSTVSGDIKKQKYVYYSCHNSKRLCVKQWVKEEALLKALLSYFDDMKLTDAQINEIVDYIEADEIQLYESARRAQKDLNQQFIFIQERISKLVDLHLDGKIDSQTYHFKLEEYKKEQQRLTIEIRSYDTEIKGELVAAKEVLDLAKNAREIFMSSKLDEKQQLLGFFFSNLQLNAEKLHVELREPFKTLANVQEQHIWRS